MADYGKPLPENPLVSVIIDTYYRPELLKRAVKCILEQTYRYIELIIVNNGATPETIEYLSILEKQVKEVVFVHFKENQFSWDDPLMMIRICFNAGLEVATGDIVFYQSDDDWVAIDFIERMVKLFVGNPNCTTAIGRVVNALHDGTILDKYPVRERSKYIDGYLLALDFLAGTNKIVQPNPGHSFVIKRDILIKCGRFQEIFEYHQMLGIVPFGVTGFDPEALMFWGRGPEQLNVIINKTNKVFWGKFFINNIRSTEHSLIEKWRNTFGDDEAAKVEKHLHYQIMQTYYRMRMVDLLKLKFNTRKKISEADMKYISGIPVESAIIWDAFRFAGMKHKRFRYIFRAMYVAKMLITSPRTAVNKVISKINKH